MDGNSQYITSEMLAAMEGGEEILYKLSGKLIL